MPEVISTNGPDKSALSGVDGTAKAGAAISLAPTTHPSSMANAILATVQPDDSSVDLKALFLSASALVKQITGSLSQFCLSKDLKQKASVLTEMHGFLRQLRSELSAGRLEALATLCGCLGRLLSSLGSNLGQINPSRLRTISNAVDFLRTTIGARYHCREVEKVPLRIMIVDDDAVCRRAMLLALSSGDLKLCTCESGEAALEQLSRERVDVIFTDIMMPGLNGYDLARKIRELPGHWSTPIVFVTSLSDFDARSKSVLSGGCELIAKPITASELVVKAFTFALRHRIASDEFSSAKPATGAKQSAEPSAEHLGVIHVEPDGIIRKANHEALYLLDHQPGELSGQPIANIFPDHLQTGQDALTIKALFAGEYKTRRGVKMFALRKDRSIAPLGVSVSETLAADSLQFVIFLRNLETPKPNPVQSPPLSTQAKTSAVGSVPGSSGAPPTPANTSGNGGNGGNGSIPAIAPKPGSNGNGKPANVPSIAPPAPPQLLTPPRPAFSSTSSVAPPTGPAPTPLAVEAPNHETANQRPATLELQVQAANRRLIRLEQQLAELDRAHSSAQGTLRALSASEKQLRTQTESLQRQLAAAGQLLSETQQKLDEESAARAAAEKQAAGLAQRRASLEEAVVQQGRAHQETLDQMEQTQAKLQKNLAALNSVQGDLVRFREEANAARAEAASAQTTVGELKQRIKDLEAREFTNAERLSQAEERVAGDAAARQALEASGARAQAAQQELIALRENHRGLEAKAAELQARSEAAEKRAAALEQVCVGADRERSRLQAEVADLAKRETESRHRCGLIEAELQASAQLLAEAQARLSEQREAIATSERLIKDTGASRTQLAKQIEELSTALSREAGQRQQWETQATEAAKSRESLLKDLADAEAHDAELEKRIEALTASETALSQKLSDATGQLGQQVASNRFLENALAENRIAQTEAARKLQQLTEESNRHQTRIEQLSKALDQESADRQHWKSQALQAAEARQDLLNQLSALEGTLAENRTAQAEVARKLQELTEESNRHQARVEELSAALDQETADRQHWKTQAQHAVEACENLNHQLTCSKAHEAVLEEQYSSLREELRLSAESLSRESAAKAQAEASVQDLIAKTNESTEALELARKRLEESAARETQLENEVRKQRQELSASGHSIRNLQSRIETLTASEAGVTQRLDDAIGQLAQQAASSRFLENALAETRTAHAEAAQKLREMTEQANHFQTRAEKLSSALDQETSERQRWNTQALQATEACENLDRQLAESKAREAALEEQCGSLREEVRVSAESLARESAAKAQAEASVQDLTAKTNEVAGALENARKRFEASEAREAQLDNEVCKQRQELSASEQAIHELEGRIETLNKQLADSQAREAALDEQSSELEKSLAALRGDLAERAAAEVRLLEERDRLVTEQEELGQQVKALSSELEQERAVRRFADSLNAESASARARLEQELASQMGNRARLRQQLSISHHREEAMRRHSAIAAKHHAAVERELSETRVTLARSGEANAELMRQVAALEADCTGLAAQGAETAKRLGDALAAGKELECRHDGLAKLANQQQETIAALEHREQELEESVCRLESSVAERSSQLTELRTELRTQVHEREAVQTQLAALANQSRELAEALRAKTVSDESSQRRVLELDGAMKAQGESLARTAAALAVSQGATAAAEARVRELLRVQTALCRRVAELDHEDESTAATA